MKKKLVHVAVVAALTSVSGLTYQSASAQEGLEEILVTATRREQNLQETPISIAAFGEDEIERRRITNIAALRRDDHFLERGFRQGCLGNE